MPTSEQLSLAIQRLNTVYHEHKATVLRYGVDWVLEPSGDSLEHTPFSGLFSQDDTGATELLSSALVAAVIRQAPPTTDGQPLRTQEKTLKLVQRVADANLAWLMEGDDQAMVSLIELVTSLHAAQGYQISTLLRCFLSFRKGMEQVFEKIKEPKPITRYLLQILDDVYFQSVFKMSDVYTSKLYEKIEERQVRLDKTNHDLELSMQHRMETNQALLEQMVSINGLSRLASEFAAISDREGLLEAIAKGLRRIVSCERVYLDLIGSGHFGFEHFELSPSDGVVYFGRRKFDPGSLIYEVVNSGKSMWCDERNESAEIGWSIIHSDIELRSGMLVTVSASDKPLGVLTLLGKSKGLFDDRVRPVVEQLGKMLGTNLVLRDAVTAIRSSLQLSDNILSSMFPEPVAGRLKKGVEEMADKIDCAGVFFCDLAGFTAFASSAHQDATLRLLREYFGRIEAVCARHKVEKIKTIGDAFMAVTGVSIVTENPMEALADFAIEVADVLKEFLSQQEVGLNYRIGIHAGPLIAGVLGKNRPAFDVWGDTVNMASRLESHADRGKIACSQTMYEELKDRYSFELKGSVSMKGKGEQAVWHLNAKNDASC